MKKELCQNENQLTYRYILGTDYTEIHGCYNGKP